MERLVGLWAISNIEIVEIEYIGEMSLQGADMIQSDLIFRKNNSIYSHLGIYVPVNVGEDVFKKTNIGTNLSIFFEYIVNVLADSIIFLYNSTNPRSYIAKYHNDISVSVSNDLYRENIYRVVLKIFGKEESIYFDVDRSQLFVK